jgi:hypothetical protein
MVAIAICLASTEIKIVAQNYQVDVAKQGSQYDINVSQGYNSIDLSGIKINSYSPSYTSGINLNTVSKVGDALTKKYHENQDLYYNVANQISSLPVNNDCQRELKALLMYGFEANVKLHLGKDGDRWFDSGVKQAILDGVLTTNRAISDTYYNPCVASNTQPQVEQSQQSNYEYSRPSRSTQTQQQTSNDYASPSYGESKNIQRLSSSSQMYQSKQIQQGNQVSGWYYSISQDGLPAKTIIRLTLQRRETGQIYPQYSIESLDGIPLEQSFVASYNFNVDSYVFDWGDTKVFFTMP